MLDVMGGLIKSTSPIKWWQVGILVEICLYIRALGPCNAIPKRPPLERRGKMGFICTNLTTVIFQITLYTHLIQQDNTSQHSQSNQRKYKPQNIHKSICFI
ncbi:hypothetical protein BDZ91DRAFT_93704 [Kalaharituber pfeilii]|nr:hypothetical protein BDZ91DRAFT_93704 [Kalaharituber pfeilii]